MKNSINIVQVIAVSDQLAASGNFAAVGEHLRNSLEKAREAGDLSAQLTIYSELMGHYRMGNDRENALSSVRDGIKLLDLSGNRNTVSGGTILINAATALQAFGKMAEALELYREAYGCYENRLRGNDPLFAALFNNMASVYADAGEFDTAEAYYITAMDILEKNGKYLDCATACVNLARLNKDTGLLDKAMIYFDRSDIPRDGYYAHVAGKCAGAFGEFGQNLRRDELVKRAKEIYERY